MSRYYAWQSRIYDVTRPFFLFGRDALLGDLHVERGQTVVEVGCGTGYNLAPIVRGIGPTGSIFAVDCAKPMLERCSRRIQEGAFTNVQLIEREYGTDPITNGQADIVLLSYSLSMIPNWHAVLNCARRELKPGGRIGVVDFCLDARSRRALAFARWMAIHRVHLDHPYTQTLRTLFRPLHCVTRQTLCGLWSFYRFVGERT